MKTKVLLTEIILVVVLAVMLSLAALSSQTQPRSATRFPPAVPTNAPAHIDWLGYPVLLLGGTNDSPTRILRSVEIGLRGDGVLVWRARFKHEVGPTAPANRIASPAK